MSVERISIVGIGLEYPDAGSPDELWENVLAGRRAFRRLPDERMNRADYYSPDPAAPDRFYAQKAAVLRDFDFDRVRYKVAGSTFRATDTTHWLALDVAARALADAGFADGDGVPKASTGVVIGNSLTGEFSRANIMRLRWPYVRRTVAAALATKGWGDDETATFLRELEVQYKEPFPEINEDSLAGGLANTIAGRVCNYFDFAGGGFTVDGACSSSLLAVVSAANALVQGDLDVAIAGGVDLSIDPFEVIGFAKTGALAKGEMKVYDADSNGFWPGEGSGMLVLMRETDAIAQGKRIYASIGGWGVSSDGKGGITRPEAAGHRLALSRAYGRAGYGVETVSYFEGHGTGTALGDATEIEALSTARRDADPLRKPAALSTIKGNIGHTKAAAGVAGLIKATLAVYHQVIPPGTGHFEPHESLTGGDARMYVPREAELWPSDEPVRAGVSAMGFGGINSHITVTEAPNAARRKELDEHTRTLVGGRQDAELLLLDADDVEGLQAKIAGLLEIVPKLSMAELTDLAARLGGELSGKTVRAAVVAGNPEQAERKLTKLAALLGDDASVFVSTDGIFAGARTSEPKIGYLFPGQGSGKGGDSALRRRFAAAEDIHRAAGLPETGDQVATEVAQPRIVTGSLAGLRVLRRFGIDAQTATGHSLGELTALHWAGALDERAVLKLAAIRGQVMSTASDGDGAMAGVAASPSRTEELGLGPDVVIAGYNAPEQTVISGPAPAVDRVIARARAEGVTATRIKVSHAFHSPGVEPAAAAMTERLPEFDFARLDRPVVSTVTGDVLHAAENLPELLREQIVLPVRFREAAAKVAERSDLVLEVGPGRVLTGLFGKIAPETPVLAIDTDAASLTPLLKVVGAAFALGTKIDVETLFSGRVVRSLPEDGVFNFLASPCEAAPEIDSRAPRCRDRRRARAEGNRDPGGLRQHHAGPSAQARRRARRAAAGDRHRGHSPAGRPAPVLDHGGTAGQRRHPGAGPARAGGHVELRHGLPRRPRGDDRRARPDRQAGRIRRRDAGGRPVGPAVRGRIRPGATSEGGPAQRPRHGRVDGVRARRQPAGRAAARGAGHRGCGRRCAALPARRLRREPRRAVPRRRPRGHGRAQRHPARRRAARPRRIRAGQDTAAGGPVGEGHHRRPGEPGSGRRGRAGTRHHHGGHRSRGHVGLQRGPLRRRRPPQRAKARGGQPGRCRPPRRSTAPTSCWSPVAARASPRKARWRWRRTPARSSACSAAATRPTTPSWPRTSTG